MDPAFLNMLVCFTFPDVSYNSKLQNKLKFGGVIINIGLIRSYEYDDAIDDIKDEDDNDDEAQSFINKEMKLSTQNILMS